MGKIDRGVLCMKGPRICHLAWALFFVAFTPAQSSEPSSKWIISEGDYIGYATVADALAALKARGLMQLAAPNGSVSIAEPDNKTTWTFTGKGDPAYPAAARTVFTKTNDSVHVEMTVLCEAAQGPCEKFRSDIRFNVEQVSRMSNDPSLKCRVDGETIDCSQRPAREHSNQQLYVQIADDGACTVDSLAVPCLDVGKHIRAEHPSDDPKVDVCGSAALKYDAVGRVLRVLSEEDLPSAFGCPPPAP